MVLDYDSVLKQQYKYVDVVTTLNPVPKIKLKFQNKQYDKLVYSGYLSVVDPVSKSVILCSIDDKRSITQSILVIGNIIDQVIESKDGQLIFRDEVGAIIERDRSQKVQLHPYYRRNEDACELTREEIIERRNEIVDWLRKNRLEVELDSSDDTIIVLDKLVRIKAPYSHSSSYVCPTRVILNRVQHIINSRPQRCHDQSCSSF